MQRLLGICLRLPLPLIPVVVWTIFGLSVAGVADARELKISTPTPPPHVWTKAARLLAERIATLDSDRFELKVYPLGQLGDTPALLSLLQSGALEFAIVPAGDLARWEPAFSAWFLPFLFEDVEQAATFAQSDVSKEILQLLHGYDVVGLGYIFPGQRHLLSRYPVTEIEHIHQRKIRVFPNEIFKSWWQNVGAAPVAVALPQVAPSLMTGVLDAIDADLDIIVGLKFYEQAPHLVLTNHMSFPGVFLVSRSWWESLSDESRAELTTIVDQLQTWGVAEVSAAELENLKRLESVGVDITTLEQSKFSAIESQVLNEFLGRHRLVQEFYEAARQFRTSSP